MVYVVIPVVRALLQCCYTYCGRSGRQQISCGAVSNPQNALETAARNLQKMAVVLGSSLFVAGVCHILPQESLWLGLLRFLPSCSALVRLRLCGLIQLHFVQASQALTYDELQGLTYLQVKGSGIANTCPVLEGGSSNLKDLKPGSYNMSKFCLEPTSFTVKEESQFKGGEPEFVKTKLMTRLTYTLDEVHHHLPT